MKLLCFFLSFVFIASTVDAQFTDSFTDGDFTNNPTWTGDTADFVVNGSNQLQLNAPAVTSTKHLVTPSRAIKNAVWQFDVHLDFNPSSSNYADVYLISNDSAIENAVDGYYVEVGSSNDDICLYRQDGSSSTKIIDGTDGRLNVSSPSVKIKVTRDSLGDWQLISDTSASGTNPFVEGNDTDNTYTTSSYFGVYCNYTSTRSTKFYFDNFDVTGAYYTDTVKPVIDSVDVISQNKLDVFFSEIVDPTTAQNASDYSVNNSIGNPSTAVRDASNKSIVHLTFGNSFTLGQSYTLTTTNVEDTSGNAMLQDQHNFTYFTPATAHFRDVVINELMPDPSPQVGLPNAEYVEIFNSSDSVYDLNNWTITDGTSTGTLSQHYFHPGDYLILCSDADTSAFSVFGQTMGVGSLPSLNNSSDNIQLFDNTHTLIDEVDYDISWYNDASKEDGGWSLEQINPNLPCSNQSNWAASTNPNGGTPGAQNSIYSNAPDTLAPFITSVEMLSLNQLQVNFSEPMDSASLATASYNINNGISVSNVAVQSPNFNAVILTLTPQVDSSTAYLLTMNGGSDCSGNALVNDSIRFGFGVAPMPYDIVINEIFPNPDNSVGLPNSEYAELYNRTNKVLNLKNCIYANTTTSTTLQNVSIYPHSYLILCPSTSVASFTQYGQVVGLSNWPTETNSGGHLELRNANNETIITLDYSDTWYQDPAKEDGGWSLEMIDPNNPCGTLDNWHASLAAIGGTPGAQNSDFAPNPDNIPPKLLTAIAYNDSTVVLSFDEHPDSVHATNAQYYITNGIIVASIQLYQYGSNSVTVHLASHLQTNQIYTITVGGLTDCVGNVIGGDNSAQFALPQQPIQGDLVINEVLFNPNTGGSDFVELYNNSNKFIDLYHCYMNNADNDGLTADKGRIEQHYMLFPGHYVMISEDTANIKQNYPKAHDNAFMQIDYLPSYNSDEGTVQVLDSNQISLDKFDYNENMQFALLNSDKGVSLERISFDRPTDDPTNWHSASQDVGFATPGYQNSQIHLVTDNTGTVTVEPEIFSPDNDGYNDVENIHYNFPKGGYVGNITIYDKNGRIIRHLMQNETLATSGVISWDGIGDNHEKARMGIYVIYFEAFDLKGNVKHYKKTCVLGGYLNK